MRVLIIQPKLAKHIEELDKEIQNHPEADAVILPEGYLNDHVERACLLAKTHNKILIGGYRRFDETPKDRAILIDRSGQ